MKNYDMKHIRNLAFVGASGAGKTSLAEQMLFNAKASTRVGKVEDGNTVMDFQPEEIEKGMSMSLGVAFLEWKNHLINILDTPGYADFANEQSAAATAVENMVIVANGAAGFEVGLEQTLELLENTSVSKSLIINRLDNEGADFYKTIETIKENSDINPIPIYLPIGSESRFEGIADIIKQKAFIKGNEQPIPDSMSDQVEEYRMALMEAIAESDDSLLEKYFEEGILTDAEINTGLKKAILKGNMIPVFACSATHNIAVDDVLNAVMNYLPSPEDANQVKVMQKDEEKTIIASPNGELAAYVFKSTTDPNLGDLAFVRVFSGTLKSGLDVLVPEKDSKDRIGSMFFVRGKNRIDAQELSAGMIGSLVKIKVARSYNSIVAQNAKYQFPAIELPSPVYWQAVRAVNQSDEDKIGQALERSLEEDATLHLDMNPETKENVLSGIGEQQIGLVLKKLKSRYKIDAELSIPKVPYRETIRGKADVSYRHKKQSGGRGQYGEVYFRVSPLERGEGFKFVNSVVGGTIPSKFIPAIEKGLVEVLQKGIVSGNPIVDICVDVYFGSYHDVDSSEMAFKIATWQCMKKAFEVAVPILLEPVHEAQIIIPTEYMGDVMGDISTRRGKILGMEQKGKKQILNAHVPLAELFNYFPALKSLTQGRGKFVQKFSHYEKVPDEIAAKVIEAANER
jgi:elongation factor G